MPNRSERIPSPAVARAMEVLEALATEPGTLSELSRKLGVPKSSLHNIVATLKSRGWVESRDGNFMLGPKLFRTGVLYGRNRGLVMAFNEVAPQVVEQTGETTWLGVLDGSDVVHVARVEGTQQLRFVAREGERIPAHTTALGKVILASKEPDDLHDIFGSEDLPSLTDRTVTEFPELVERLRAVREQGYALDLGEVDPSLHCVAAPVRDATGEVIAGVSLAGAEARFAESVPDYTGIILDAARSISRRLGYESVARQEGRRKGGG